MFLKNFFFIKKIPLQHGFFTRLNGLSKKKLKSLNCNFSNEDDMDGMSDTATAWVMFSKGPDKINTEIDILDADNGDDAYDSCIEGTGFENEYSAGNPTNAGNIYFSGP